MAFTNTLQKHGILHILYSFSRVDQSQKWDLSQVKNWGMQFIEIEQSVYYELILLRISIVLKVESMYSLPSRHFSKRIFRK